MRREDETPAFFSSAPSSGSGTGFSREELIAKREARLLAHLDAANAALAEQRCDTAEEAARNAALLDPDDQRVQQMFERIAAARRALEFERHLADARAYLADLALTKASESVDHALQVQPNSPTALQLRRRVEQSRVIRGRLENAEQSFAAGDLVAALRSADEVLATDPAHEAALRLRERVGIAERDRASAVVERARRQRATGDLAAARKTLQQAGVAHESIAAELASVEAELRERRESFESLVEQARRRLEHGNLEDARDPVRRALDALSPGDESRSAAGPGGSAATPPGGAASATPSNPASDTGTSIPADQPALFSVVGGAVPEGKSGKPVSLAAIAVVATLVVGGALAATLWLATTSPGEQELAPVAADESGGFGGSTGGAPLSRDSAGSGSVPASPPDAVPETVAEEPGSRPPAPAPAEPPPIPRESTPPPPQRARPTSPPSPPVRRTPTETQPVTPSVAQLLADAVAAEAAGEAGQARELYTSVLSREPDNRTARTGRLRVQAEMARERLRAGDAAFTAGRYDDARRHYEEAANQHGSADARARLRHVANVQALTCSDGAACGTLVVRVTPAAEIFIDDRALGTTTALELRLPSGSHRVRLETDDWRFPRALDILPGATVTGRRRPGAGRFSEVTLRKTTLGERQGTFRVVGARWFRANEVFDVAFEALGRYRLRTALSTLGIVLGVAAVIAMLAVGEGARADILRQVEQLGLNNVVVRSRDLGGPDGLQVGDARLLRDLLPGANAVSPLVERFVVAAGPRNAQRAAFLGVVPEYGSVLDLAVARGRFLGPLDRGAHAPVCVLGARLGRRLFGRQDPVGRQVRLDGTWCEVAGVLVQRSTGERSGGRIAAARDLDGVAIGALSAVLPASPATDPTQRIDEVWIRFAGNTDVAAVAASIERTLARARGGRLALEIVVPRDLLNQRARTQSTFNVVVGSVAVLSLLVGGIGIMNVMLTSVLERTREIGLRRVVGATRRVIVVQFLTESLIMTLAGGILGVAAGVATSHAITAYAGWSTRVSLLSIALAFGVSALVGLAFGIYPAAQAASLQPVDAVRYE